MMPGYYQLTDGNIDFGKAQWFGSQEEYDTARDNAREAMGDNVYWEFCSHIHQGPCLPANEPRKVFVEEYTEQDY